MEYISINGSQLVVYINRVVCKQSKYFLQLISGSEVLASFDMKKDKLNKWNIVQPAPDWVNSLQNELSSVLSGEEIIQDPVTKSN